LRSEVQPAQTNVSTANAVVDSTSPIQTQLSAVHDNIHIGWYPNSGKAVKDDKKYNRFANSNTTPPKYDFKNANGARAFVGNFLCRVERVRRFVKVHLHCIVRHLKKN